MADRFTTTAVRSYSSGTRGRCISNARSNHFVNDDADYSGGPHEAITAAEAFLSGVTACAVLMIERIAREEKVPLRRVDARIEATRDREAVHEVHAVYDRVRMRVELTGPSEAQARDLVEKYQRR
jgi:uncharacterized OsmC-like protein